MRFLIEGYLEQAICAMINLKKENLETTTIHEKANKTFSQLLSFILFAFPIFIICFLHMTPEDKLRHDPEVRKVYGSIFEGLKLHRKRGIAYFFMFTLRRLFMAMNLVFLQDYPVF
jgi:phosphoribosyl 1,2-cyclic phosphodiesterase